MATVDNSKIFMEGAYSDATVKVPAKTTFKKGLVLGRNADGELTAFSTENNVEAVPADGETPAVEGFTTSPIYILAQNLTNEEETAEEFPLVRVFECGAVNKDKLIFDNKSDAEDVEVLDALKRNGFSLETVVELTEETSLAE